MKTLKGFLHRASSAKSAIGFLASHKDFIQQYQSLATILESYESGQEIASVALQKMKDIAFAAMVENELNKAKEKSAKPNVDKTEKVKKCKNYTVIINVKYGEGKVATFDMMQDAERWADRRLFEDASSVSATIESMLKGKDNNYISWEIMRGDSIARVLKQKAGPVSKGTAKTSALSFRPKVHNDKAYFSKG